MQRLMPYQSSAKLKIEADLKIDSSNIFLDFHLDQADSVEGLRSDSVEWSGDQVSRRDGLWSSTCFEAFLNPCGLDLYYEFNFSLDPAWNVYEFASYRQPQPPAPTAKFQLQSMIWNPSKKHLHVGIENRTRDREFFVGLTAIVVEKNNTKNYWALAHTREKPDFHAKDSFKLQRGPTR